MREPALDGPPPCFTAYRNDTECEVCPFQKRCVKSSEFVRSRETLAEITRRLTDEYRTEQTLAITGMTPRALGRFAAERWRAMCEKDFTRHWTSDKNWLYCWESVLNACVRAKWNPRLFVRAQIETVGWYMAKKLNIPHMKPVMFVGGKSGQRFLGWSQRNAAKYGAVDRDREATAVDEVLLVAESTFAEFYCLNMDASVSDVSAYVTKQYPTWSLAVTRPLPHIRHSALHAVAIGIDSNLPHRLLMPPKWSWGEARHMLRSLHPGLYSLT